MLRRFSITCGLLLGLPAMAGGYSTQIIDTGVISVQGAALQQQRTGATYSASGSGIDVTTAGGLSATGVVTPTEWSPSTGGQAFSFSETLYQPDPLTNTITGTSDASTTAQFGSQTFQFAGDAGTSNILLSPDGVADVTIGSGATGVTGTAQRTVTLSVFD